ncbi:MAG: asparagine synthase (glutamine-hydrolyzing) [Bacteroidia bacterium]
MCGISGIYGFSNQTQREQWVKDITNKLKHRGPDNQSVYSDEEISLGHARLSIIDLASVSNQPMHSDDKRYTIVFNGEIYNYEELKNLLPDYNYSTNSDTEVLLAAYKKWGKNMLHQLNGMFAFAIWDKQQKELFIARDRMGVKPLYYFANDKGLVFSSEISSILDLPFIDKKLNLSALSEYFRYFTVNAPNTLIKEVKMLPSGSYLVLNQNEFYTKKYWDERTNYTGRGYSMNENEVHSEINRLFHESIKRRLIADVPFGAFLSGGIDSSLVVATMSEYSSNVKTFNVSFEEKEFSEAKYANIIADKFSTNHTEIKLTPNDFLQSIPVALQAQDFPSLDGFNSYLVSKVTKQSGVTMALSGLGGDELFAGYDVFKQLNYLKNNQWISSFPSTLRILPAYLYKTLKPSVASRKLYDALRQDYLDIEHLYPFSRQIFLENELKDLLTIEPASNTTFQFLKGTIGFGSEGYNMPFLSKISYAEFNTYMQNVLLRDTDVMSMAHALEVRVPFLDYHLVEFVLGVSDNLKNPTSPKKLLINSFKNVLPDEVVNRKKMGFVFPWEMWLKNELKDLTISNLENLKKRDFINAKEVDIIWNNFVNGRTNWSRIWGLVVLENWLNKNNIEC